PKQLDRLGKLEASASHLLEIINAILDMTKIDSGKMLLEDEPICLHQIVNAVTAMLSERMQDKGLQLRTEIFPLNFNLRGDATRLRQALLNYATNAIKFTPAGSITVRTLLLKETPVDALIRFEVRDTGVGINTAVISRLFSNFEQADKTISRNYGGTGLGLAITKKISELMGGDAGVESEEGKGSTFWFTAKLRKDQAVKLDSEVHTPVSFSESNLKNILSGARILLAEDESINQEIAVFMLEEVHMVVDTAENGEQAVQFASDKDYDLILMDMNMPVMDGLLATQKIRQSRRNAEIPILAMTANAFVEDRNQCIAAGMNDFISKPVELDVLYAKLEKWLSR
ncbi:MAG: ATP-binding protein, partial [Anaerolineales bacterium]|nr:ATP-binding protein [Anaerolineales bacterium]